MSPKDLDLGGFEHVDQRRMQGVGERDRYAALVAEVKCCKCVFSYVYVPGVLFPVRERFFPFGGVFSRSELKKVTFFATGVQIC